MSGKLTAVFHPYKNIHYCIEIENPVLFEACCSNDVTTPVTLLVTTGLDNRPKKTCIERINHRVLLFGVGSSIGHPCPGPSSSDYT